MKSKVKLILSVLVIGINFAILMVSIYYLNLSSKTDGDDGHFYRWIPVFIDGNGTNNWVWAVSQPWCHGSGTWDDPYTIENLIINGNGAEACIKIRDSNAFF